MSPTAVDKKDAQKKLFLPGTSQKSTSLIKLVRININTINASREKNNSNRSNVVEIQNFHDNHSHSICRELESQALRRPNHQCIVLEWNYRKQVSARPFCKPKKKIEKTS